MRRSLSWSQRCLSTAIPVQQTCRESYSRIDIPLNALNPIADALLCLLQLVSSRLDHLSVMAFISKPVVRARFQLSTDHTDQLKNWIQQAQIRWGINAEDRHHNEQPPFDDYTWEQGIERMVLGFAMHSQESSPFNLSPLDTIEGGDGYTLLRGAECIRSVLFFARSFEAPCSSAQWQERLKTDSTLDPHRAGKRGVMHMPLCREAPINGAAPPSRLVHRPLSTQK